MSRFRRACLPFGVAAIAIGLARYNGSIPLYLRVCAVTIGVCFLLVSAWRPGFDRFPLRAAMLGIAVLAFLLGALVMAVRSDQYFERARDHAIRSTILSHFSQTNPGGRSIQMAFETGGPMRIYRSDQVLAMESWHASLAARYAKAARQPWIAVDPVAERTQPSPPKSPANGAGR